MTGAWNKGILTGVLAASLVAGGCASNRQRELEEQNKTLAAACDDLRRRNDALERELATLKGDRGIRDAYIKKLEEETEALKRAIAKLQELGEPIAGEPGVRFLEDMLFRPGSDDISKEGAERLAKVADIIKSDRMYVRIVGHTDNDPIKRTLKDYPTGMNLQLGACRAVAVAGQLKKSGVDEHRMHVVSMGESAPIGPNDTKENKRRNRRVDIYFSDKPPAGATPADAVEPEAKPVSRQAPPSK